MNKRSSNSEKSACGTPLILPSLRPLTNPSRLIKNTVETLRTRLDRIYLEAILAAERSGESKPATEDDVKALEEELESLYSEILPVAQMSAEQQHLEPALKSTNSSSGQSLNRSASAIAYVRISSLTQWTSS